MKIYNSLSHKKEDFIPRDGNKVSMYTCGPTVYHYAHIGNLRSYIMEDILEKYLRYAGYDVTRVMNITDVGHLTSDGDTGDDKMLKGVSVFWCSRLQLISVHQVVRYSDIEVVELRCLCEFSFDDFSVCRYFISDE